MSLTTSERRVAPMTVAGLANIEITPTLIVTRKTVGKNLRNCNAKLGVHSRTELAALHRRQ